MYNNWKIVRIPFVNSNWVTASSTVITTLYDPSYMDKIGDGKDSFSFKLTNFNDTYDNYFQIGDKLLIYQKANTSSLASSDILCTGIIKNIPETETGAQNLIRLEGTNFSETLMNAIAFTDGQGVSIPTFIANALNSVNAYNGNFRINFSSSTIAQTNTSGSTFPAVYEQWFNKSVLSLLEKYSQKEYTQDVNYYFYVDAENNFYWKPRTSNTTSTFNSETSKYTSIDIKKDLKDVVNFVIVKGGRTPGGRILSNRASDPVSTGRNGFRYKLITSTKARDETVGLDMKKHGNTVSEFPGSYPFTTAWKSSSTGNFVTVANDTEYEEAVFAECKIRLKNIGNEYIDLRKDGKLQVVIEFEPDVKYDLGGMISVTIPKIGKSNYPMRVEERQFTLTSNTFTLIEDEGSI